MTWLVTTCLLPAVMCRLWTKYIILLYFAVLCWFMLPTRDDLWGNLLITCWRSSDVGNGSLSTLSLVHWLLMLFIDASWLLAVLVWLWKASAWDCPRGHRDPLWASGASGGRRYVEMSSLIGWAGAQGVPWSEVTIVWCSRHEDLVLFSWWQDYMSISH